ncbi:MAG TPA: hypothetical protein PLU61_12235 [Rhodoglobus sp.]|nr:hypothetical protein [Rhodoglobus sp.]
MSLLQSPPSTLGSPVVLDSVVAPVLVLLLVLVPVLVPPLELSPLLELVLVLVPLLELVLVASPELELPLEVESTGAHISAPSSSTSPTFGTTSAGCITSCAPPVASCHVRMKSAVEMPGGRRRPTVA